MLLSKLAMLLSVPVPGPPSTAVSRRLSAVTNGGESVAIGGG